jgi:hypothetical protein
VIALLILAAALGVTYVGTHAALDRARRAMRLAWHRRLTRKHGQMLQRTLGGVL